MSIKDWYHYFKRDRTHYHKVDTDEWLLKKSRVENLHPNLNHLNCYEKIRKSGLPSRLLSALLKTKLDLYLTEERRLNCNITNSSKCLRCARIDYVGHILICSKNPYRKICETIIKLYTKAEEDISLEGIMNSDFQGSNEDFYPLGWILATLIDHVYENNNVSETGIAILRAKYQHDKNTIDALQNCPPKVLQLSNNLDLLLQLQLEPG